MKIAFLFRRLIPAGILLMGATGLIGSQDPLPKVLIIGDSISIGYMEPLKELLEDIAVLEHNPGNAQHSRYGLEKLDEWLGDTQWDVIHFNHGLHDLKYVDEEGNNVSSAEEGHIQISLEEYGQNMEAIVRRLKETNARLIFATTTPYPAEKEGPLRTKEDASRYNDVAVEVMKRYQVEINDLYAFVLPRLEELQRPQNVHFTKEGSQELAEEVALHIREVLGNNTSVPEEENVKVYTYKHTEQGDLKLVIDFPSEWKATDSRSAIVFFFGGGWAWSAINHFERQAQYFASRGMVSIRPYVRVKDPHGTTPVESVDDALSAMRWIRSHADSLGINARQIVASGGSSGGHVAACLSQCARPQNLDEERAVSAEPDAMVLFNPLLGFYNVGTVEELYPVESEEVARQISPELHIEKNEPPVLLLFGTEDDLFTWASTYIEKSRMLENRVDLYLVQGEDHGFFNDSPWYEHTLVRVDDFLVSLGFLDKLSVTLER